MRGPRFLHYIILGPVRCQGCGRWVYLGRDLRWHDRKGGLHLCHR